LTIDGGKKNKKLPTKIDVYVQGILRRKEFRFSLWFGPLVIEGQKYFFKFLPDVGYVAINL